jgi:hypothetical protein
MALNYKYHNYGMLLYQNCQSIQVYYNKGKHDYHNYNVLNFIIKMACAITINGIVLSGVSRRGFGVFKPTQNSEVLTKLSRIPSSVENTSVTT